MRKLILFGMVLTTVLLFSGTAFALSYATDVLWDNTGINVTAASRTDSNNALGEPDGNFLSIGLGGIAAFDFGVSFDATAIVFETTWGNRDNYPEYANVYVGDTFSLDPGDYTFVGLIRNDVDQIMIDLTGTPGNPFQYVLVQDATEQYGGFTQFSGNPADGFDIDAVAVAPVPEPATVLLFGVGLIGLAGFGRKKYSNIINQ